MPIDKMSLGLGIVLSTNKTGKTNDIELDNFATWAYGSITGVDVWSADAASPAPSVLVESV